MRRAALLALVLVGGCALVSGCANTGDSLFPKVKVDAAPDALVITVDANVDAGVPEIDAAPAIDAAPSADAADAATTTDAPSTDAAPSIDAHQ